MFQKTVSTIDTVIFVPSLPMTLESMDDASDGEQLQDSLISEEKSAKSKRGTRSEREDQLKKLLDDDGKTALAVAVLFEDHDH